MSEFVVFSLKLSKRQADGLQKLAEKEGVGVETLLAEGVEVLLSDSQSRDPKTDETRMKHLLCFVLEILFLVNHSLKMLGVSSKELRKLRQDSIQFATGLTSKSKVEVELDFDSKLS